MKLRKGIPLVMALVALLAACSKTPSGVIGKEKMARIIADLSIAEAVVESDYKAFPTDSDKLALKQSIYLKNKVTPEQVDTSLRWYGRNMDILVEVYDRAIEMTEHELKSAALSAASMPSTKSTSIYATEGDSIDLWTSEPSRIFAPNMPTDISTFHLISDRNWQNGDIFTLSARATEPKNPVRFAITAEYQDGTREYVTSGSPSSGWHRLKIALNPDKKASMIYGYILYTPAEDEVVALDSISLVRTRISPAAEGIRRNIKSFASDYEHHY